MQNPPQLAPGVSDAACLDVTQTFDFSAYNVRNWTTTPPGFIADLAVPFGGVQTGTTWMWTDGPTHVLIPFYAAPATATAFRLVIHTNGGNVRSANVRFGISPDPNSVSGNSITTPVPANGSTYDSGITALAKTGQQSYFISWATDSATDNPNCTIQLEFFCGGTTAGQPLQPCCPPDEATQNSLQALMQLVTLIQRQTAPFSYVLGTAHAGLSGNGSFSVQGLLGCKVQIDAFSSQVGLEGGDPDVVWQGGWINWGNADGVSPRQFIASSPMVSLPTAAGQFTSVHYSLPPGVVVTITELVREP